MRQNKDNNALKSFFLASVIYAVLVGLFVYFFASKIETKNVGMQTTSLAISLTKFQSAPKPVEEVVVEEVVEEKVIEEKVIYKEEAPPKKIAKKKVVKKPKPKAKPKPKVIPQEPVQKSIEQPQVAQNVSTSGAEVAKPNEMLVFGRDSDPFLLSIKKAIDKNLFYPRKSRMMRQEGRVLVEFSVLPSGGIKSLKIVKGSGKKELDNAAIKTIQRAKKSFLKPQREVRIQIPIVFVLR